MQAVNTTRAVSAFMQSAAGLNQGRRMSQSHRRDPHRGIRLDSVYRWDFRAELSAVLRRGRPGLCPALAPEERRVEPVYQALSLERLIVSLSVSA